ncbi:MAG: DJ-1/PfpI family protein [Ignavibacteria bacterium]|nr:DJ-1/PfpI family protein [Ignavibacteria bacterium]
MRVLVPIANGTEEMEAVIIVDMLRRAGCDVVVAGDGDLITCSRRVRIVPDVTLDDIADDELFEAIVIPGGSRGVTNLTENRSFEEILLRHRKKNGLVGAICAAPMLLHELGFLRAKDVITSHPSVADVLSRYSYTIDRVAVSGSIVTSRGAGTAFEFSLELIKILFDDTTASKVATDIVLYE